MLLYVRLFWKKKKAIRVDSSKIEFLQEDEIVPERGCCALFATSKTVSLRDVPCQGDAKGATKVVERSGLIAARLCAS